MDKSTNKLTKFSVEVELKKLDEFAWLSEDKMLVEIKFGHVGLNRNGYHFFKSAWEDSFNDFAYMPILANVKKYKRDVGEHDYKFIGYDENGKKVYEYYERPVGVILGSTENQMRFVYNEELDIEQVVGYGTISKEYNYHLVKILEENPIKKVSMEVEITEGYKDEDGVIFVEKFMPFGVSLLGEEYAEGMEGSNLEVIKFAENPAYNEIKTAVCFALKNKPTKFERRSEFMTSENKYKVLAKLVSNMGVMKETYGDVEYEYARFYLMDFSDSSIYVYDMQEYKSFKCEYSEDGEENFVINAESKSEVIALTEWKDMEDSGIEGEEMSRYSQVIKDVFASKGEQIVSVVEDFTSKVEIAKQEKVDAETQFVIDKEKIEADFSVDKVKLEKEIADFAETKETLDGTIEGLNAKVEEMSDYEDLKTFKAEKIEAEVQTEKDVFIENFAEGCKGLFKKEDIVSFKEKSKDLELDALEAELQIFAWKKLPKDKETSFLIEVPVKTAELKESVSAWDKYNK